MAACAVALATVPSHESFVEHLHAAELQPQGWAGGVRLALRGASVALLAESERYAVARVGTYDGRRFVGCFGCWLPLPSVPPALADPLGVCARWLCARNASGGTWAPHEAFGVACLVVFALWHVLPEGVMWRHFTTSPSALRSGRVWTLLTAAVSHCEPIHLLHNLLSIFAVAPQLAARVPCRELAELLLASALASSCASLLAAYSADRARHAAPPSLGASGVVLALAAARATLSPAQRCAVYGVEMPASHALLVQLALDCALAAYAHSTRRHGAGRAAADVQVDVAAHAGGALCGWWIARTRWRALSLFYL